MGESIRKWMAWGGFVDGRLDLNPGAHVPPQYCGIYKTRAEARRYYQDVRPVVIRELFK